MHNLREATAWDFNLKVGVRRGVQLAVFGPGYLRTVAGTGVGDLGIALKFAGAISRRGAVAVVTNATFPTGDAQHGLGAGRVLGGALAVLSVDLPAEFHTDVNVGPSSIGAGKPQWFASVGMSRGGTIGFASELFDFTPGGVGPRQSGFLSAIVIRPLAWFVVDAGGAVGLTADTPDQLFVGLTTNFGRVD